MNFVFDSSLVLYLPLYKLDGASFMSRDAYGHLCQRTGALWRPNGHYFDGTDDRIVVAHHSALDFGTGDFSLEIWLRVSSSGGAIQRLISKQSAAWLFFRLIGGKATLSIKDGTNQQTVTGSGDLRDDIWHHLVATADRDSSTGLMLSVDGETDVTDDATGIGSISNTTPLQIARFSGGAEYFKGDMGEVRIYRRLLTPLEIQRNYLATKWRYR
jgi:hypothetical protein